MPKWPCLSGRLCIGNKAPDFSVVLDTGGGLDAARGIHGEGFQAGGGGDIVGGEAAGNEDAAEVASGELVEGESAAGAAVESGDGGEEEVIGAVGGQGGQRRGGGEAERADGRCGPSAERGRVLVAVKLEIIEPQRFAQRGDMSTVGVDEDADDGASGADRVADAAGGVEGDGAGAWRIEVEADEVGAAGDGGFGVGGAGDAADFDADGHRGAVPGVRAATSGVSARRGLPPRSRLSPMRKARAPAASRRRRWSGVSMPLSATMRARPAYPRRSISVVARSVLKECRSRLLMPMRSGSRVWARRNSSALWTSMSVARPRSRAQAASSAISGCSSIAAISRIASAPAARAS